MTLPDVPSVPIDRLSWSFTRDPDDIRRNPDRARFRAFPTGEAIADALDDWVGPHRWGTTIAADQSMLTSTIWVELNGRRIGKTGTAGYGQLGEGVRKAETAAFVRAGQRGWGISRDLLRMEPIWAPCRVVEVQNATASLAVRFTDETYPELRSTLARRGEGDLADSLAPATAVAQNVTAADVRTLAAQLPPDAARQWSTWQRNNPTWAVHLKSRQRAIDTVRVLLAAEAA